MRGRNLNLIAFVLICGAISYYDLKKCHKLPWPPRFIFAGLTFLMMELITLADETLGGVTAIGFVIAIFLKEGFVATCDQQGTGYPQDVAFMSGGSDQPPSLSSVQEFQQQQSTQQQSTGIPGPAPAMPPGTTIV